MRRIIKILKMKYLITPFKNVFDFKGTSTIKEFWYFVLITTIIHIFICLVKSSLNMYYLGDIIRVITLLPFIALGFRRLNEAGINKFLFLIPFVNLILASMAKVKRV
jgi:uncharacterized membrane protein YhaH (DUF805 family)